MDRMGEDAIDDKNETTAMIGFLWVKLDWTRPTEAAVTSAVMLHKTT